MHRFDFTHDQLTRYLERCPFTEEEKQILCLRRRGVSNIELAFATSLSDRTVSRRLKSIAEKIERENIY